MQEKPSSTRSSVAIILSIIAILVGGFVFFNQQKTAGTGSQTESTLNKVKRTGKLKAAYVLYPPFVSRDPNKEKPHGYFIDLMDEIARKGGFEVEYEQVELGTMIAGLQTKKYDTIVSAIFGTIPRAKEVTFSEPVLYVGMSAIARKDDMRIQTEEDLKKPGLRFAVLSGGAGREYVKKNLPDAEIIEVQGADFTRPMLEVLADRADVTLSESVSCAKFAREHPGTRNVFADNPYTFFGSGFVMRYGDDDWRSFLNTSIRALELGGTLQKLDRKYIAEVGAGSWFSRATPWQITKGR